MSLQDHPRERGQTMAEYVVVLSVITLALALAFGVFASGVSGALDKTSGMIKTLIP